MVNKLMSVEAAVQKYIKDRCSFMMGGFPMARTPVIFCKEILRQRKAGKLKLNDLFMIVPGIGFGGDLLVAEGVVDSCIGTFTSHERAGLSKVVRDALEKGIPRKLKWEDESNLTLNLKIMAGALNLPFVPSNSGIWGDLSKGALWNGAYPYPKNIIQEDPYGSGKKVALLQAVCPDVTVVHVPFADIRGNGIVLGSLYYDYWSGRCGKNIVLLADRIVDNAMCRQYPNMVVIPGAGVSAVIPWYMGGWPSNSPGLYGEDIEHIVYYVKNSRGAALREYIDKYVYSWDTYEEYMKLIGDDSIKAIENNPTSVLADPFRKWIYPQEKVADLLKDAMSA